MRTGLVLSIVHYRVRRPGYRALLELHYVPDEWEQKIQSYIIPWRDEKKDSSHLKRHFLLLNDSNCDLQLLQVIIFYSRES